MAASERVGVFLCRGGKTQTDALDFRRLRWTAEAGVGGANVHEITQACQTEGAAQVARVVRDDGLTSFVVGACPLAVPSASGASLPQGMELDRDGGIWLDLCRRPEGEAAECVVHAGAATALGQVLAARADRPTPGVETMTVSTDVLVVGDGLAALSAARDLIRAGYGMVLATPTKRLAPPQPLWGPEAGERAAALAGEIESQVTLIRQGVLLGLSGSAGAFQARILDREGQAQEFPVGAVVVTQGPPQRTNLEGLGIELSERVTTLGQLAGLVGSPEYLKRVFGEGGKPRVALCLGFGRETYPSSLRAACRAALALRRDFGAEVALLMGNAKVAAPDLEALTQEVRRAGGLLFKFTHDVPRIEDQGDVVELRFQDAILEREVHWPAHLVAVDEVAAPDEGYHRLAAALGLVVGRDGRLQPDKVGALPTLTPRAGVFVVGQARLESDPSGARADVGQVTQAVRQLLGRGQVEIEASRVEVDRRRCALCLTCVRVCPEGAMGFTDRRPASNPLACTACGTCASECPMDAIQLLGDEDRRYGREIQVAVGRAGSGSVMGLDDADEAAAVLVFLCQNSAAKAVENARRRGMEWPLGASFIQVPCAGKIDPGYILEAFRSGFDGVLILSCYDDACYSLEGSTWAGHRLAHLRNLLAEAGHDPRRIAQHGVAPLMSSEAMDLVEGMKRDLVDLGPNPLRAGVRARQILSRFTLPVDEEFTLLDQSPAAA